MSTARQVVRVRSVQVGLPQEFRSSETTGPTGRPWTSAIVKRSVTGPRRVGWTGLEGDGQADLEHHGGPDKAVLAYAETHYPEWRAELPETEFPAGAFGENLTLEGLSEDTVAIGDEWSNGSVRFQVSQPRQPCWKLARRLGVPDMVARVQDSLRSGWYLRVLQEGVVEEGDELSLLARPHPAWTVAEASRVMYGVRTDPTAALELAGLPELSASWARTLRLRASGGEQDIKARVMGPDP